MERVFKFIDQFINGPELAIFHEFHKPPYCGGNTFLIALEKELKKLGYKVGRNKIGKNTKAVLFNSYQFDASVLRQAKEKFNPKMIHRVDGPISTYRGTDLEIDQKIMNMNSELADVTIFQSEYSLNKHKELGLNFKNPVVITNASDSEIFNANERASKPNSGRKTRLIATSWSNNPKKGGPLLSWLDEHLDANKYELTFVGQTRSSFKNAKVIEPVPSTKLAKILKQHDIYIAPSEDDPCSNALIEALSCGLPAVYLKSGGHPELVKEAGKSFSTTDELLASIDEVATNYKNYQEKISIPTIKDIAQQYLKLIR